MDKTSDAVSTCFSGLRASAFLIHALNFLITENTRVNITGRQDAAQ